MRIDESLKQWSHYPGENVSCVGHQGFLRLLTTLATIDHVAPCLTPIYHLAHSASYLPEESLLAWYQAIEQFIQVFWQAQHDTIACLNDMLVTVVTLDELANKQENRISSRRARTLRRECR